MSSISLNMIVKNEENFLEECLLSIKDLVNEIIIADTGSEDNTIEIAKKFGAIIYNYDWKDDFADARNFVLQKTKSDWILYLDADERIDLSFHQKIRELTMRSDIDAILLKLRSKTTGSKINEQIQIVPYPRLFRNLKGIRFEGRIHEQITPSLQRNHARFFNSDIVIEHIGYSQSVEIIEKKKRRNLEGLLRIVNEEPDNAYALFQLGQNYILLNENEKGIDFLKRALEKGTLTKPVASSVYAAIAQDLNKNGKYTEAETYCSKSLEISPNQLFGRLLLGEICFNLGKYENSLKYYLESLDVVKIPERLRKTDTAIDVSYDISFVYYKLGIVSLKLKAIDNAEYYFSESYSLNKKFYLSLIELANIYFSSGKTYKALDSLKLIDLELLDDIHLLMKIAGMYEESEKYLECSKILEKVVKIDPVNAKAYFFLGNCSLFADDLINAEKYYTLSNKYAPDVPETIYNLAVVEIKKKNYKEALEQFLKLEKFQPENEDVKKRIDQLKKKINSIS